MWNKEFRSSFSLNSDSPEFYLALGEGWEGISKCVINEFASALLCVGKTQPI